MVDTALRSAATDTQRASSNGPDRVLVIGPTWVGDVVMAQSLFKALSRSQNTVIDVVVPTTISPLLARMPEVRQAIPATFRRGKLDMRKRYRLARSLSGDQYAQAFVLPNSWKSALVPYLAGIRRRTGYIGEQRWGLLNDSRKLDPSALPMTVQRFAALAIDHKAPPLHGAFEPPKLSVTDVEQKKVMSDFDVSGRPGKVLAICPGAEYGPAKQWPSGHYTEVAQEKLCDDWQVWLLGSKSDAPIARQINAACENKCFDLTGRTRLDQVADLLSLASFVVSNDSGLMHIAAALGRPQVALFGSSDPAHTPPLNERAIVEYLGLSCSPCFQRQCPLTHYDCLYGISPGHVLETINSNLEKTPCAPS